MPFHQPDSIRYYSFDLLDAAGVVNAVFTRQGGVSPAPWASLNLGSTVGDDLACVAENRQRALQALGRRDDSVYDVWQVHGVEAAVATAPRPQHTPHLKADIILTDRPQVTLLMRFADCVPILLYDPVRRAVGLAHAGWQGTVQHVGAQAVAAMQRAYGSRPADLLAAIGPAIGAHHYAVGPEVIERVRAAFNGFVSEKGAWQGLLHTQPCGEGKPSEVQFDLWAANRLVLEQAGVQHIEMAQICTACRLEEWYSHRAEQGRTGRFGAVIALRE